MSDLLFRYLLTARQGRVPFPSRLWRVEEPLFDASIEQMVETAAVRVRATLQYEHFASQTVTVRASLHQKNPVRLYDQAQPNRPRDGHFEERSEAFPIRDTFQLGTCPDCPAHGEARCTKCSGRGRTACWSCQGSGRERGHAAQRQRCPVCGGAGRRTCSNCQGAGRHICNTCRGDGQVASWTAETYTYLVEKRSEVEVPLAMKEPQLRSIVDRWFKINPERVANLKPATVARHLGFESPQALEVATQAEARCRNLEDDPHQSNHRLLFSRSEVSLAPAGYIVVRLQDEAHTYGLVGRGLSAFELLPQNRSDSVQSLDRPSQGFARTIVNQFTFSRRQPELARPPVEVVGVLAPKERPTSFLPCLAHLGSYLHRLRVVDYTYKEQVGRILGKERQEPRPATLSIELRDGRRIWLVELAKGYRLSNDRLRLMARALDGVLILDESEQPFTTITERIAAVATAPIATAFLRINTSTDDPDDMATNAKGGHVLHLEGIRRTFVEDLRKDVDWEHLYQQMWQPLRELLDAILALTTSRPRFSEPRPQP